MADLTIYGRVGCVQCKATAREAEKLGLSFIYVDLDHDIASAARLVNAGYRSLPVVECGEDIWTGFMPERLKQLVVRRAAE